MSSILPSELPQKAEARWAKMKTWPYKGDLGSGTDRSDTVHGPTQDCTHEEVWAAATQARTTPLSRAR